MEKIKSVQISDEEFIELGRHVFLAATCDGCWGELTMSIDGSTVQGLQTLSEDEFKALQEFLFAWMPLTSESEECDASQEVPNALLQNISCSPLVESPQLQRTVRAWVLMRPHLVNMAIDAVKFNNNWHQAVYQCPNELNYYPLQCAVSICDVKIVEVLLQAGARINEENRKGKTALFYAVRVGTLQVRMPQPSS
jgi:hypothetical protein